MKTQTRNTLLLVLCALIFAAVVGAQLPLGRLLRRPAGSGRE